MPTSPRLLPGSTTLSILRALRDLLPDPARWTKRVNARDKTGCPTSPTHPNACCWCLSGAVLALVGSDSPEADAIFHALHMALRGSRHPRIPEFNDTQTHPEVLALIDRAITMEEARAAGPAPESP